ncbi:hypothetical protein QEN19_000463 [Hanseniaspora menglaensis]
MRELEVQEGTTFKDHINSDNSKDVSPFTKVSSVEVESIDQNTTGVVVKDDEPISSNAEINIKTSIENLEEKINDKKDEEAEKEEDEYAEREDDEDAEREDDEDAEREDAEEVTRCLCSLTQPPDPDNQGYIQCDSCAAWQHQACVGISPETGEDLEKYWCEQCKPELHSVYDLKVNRRVGSKEPHDSLKRSHYNWELQKQTIHVEKRRRNTKKVTSGDIDIASPNELTASNLDGSEKRRPGRTSKRRGKTMTTNADSLHSSLSRSSRNRSSAAEREEIQYQNMLKKVLQESKKDAYLEDENQEAASDKNIPLNEDFEANFDTRRSKRRRVPSKKTEQSSTFDESQLNGDLQQAIPKRQRRRTAKKESESIDELMAKQEHISSTAHNELQEDINSNAQLESAPGTHKSKRVYTRRAQNNNIVVNKTGPRTRGKQTTTDSETSSGKNKSEDVPDSQGQKSHMDKLLQLAQEPSKPRATPDGITVDEMKERSAAILEFLNRSKEELVFLANEQSLLLSFVENPQFTQEYKKNVTIGDALTEMDKLAKDLILFQENK